MWIILRRFFLRNSAKKAELKIVIDQSMIKCLIKDLNNNFFSYEFEKEISRNKKEEGNHQNKLINKF